MGSFAHFWGPVVGVFVLSDAKYPTCRPSRVDALLCFRWGTGVNFDIQCSYGYGAAFINRDVLTNNGKVPGFLLELTPV